MPRPRSAPAPTARAAAPLAHPEQQRLAAHAPAFRDALLSWFAEAQRPLPWRAERSVYRTVVSEFMLQQTQVDTVLPYFARWLDQWSTWADLAAAAPEAVLAAWQGLGYYSRARRLHSLAQALVASPSGEPTSATGWQALPGIGPYTAAAIASIAQGEAVAVVDGNVVRVLARLVADATPLDAAAKGQARFAGLAQALLDPHRPGPHNEAMMELGALVCRPRAPLCLLCPVRTWCAGAAEGRPEAFPKIPRRATREVVVERVWIEHPATGDLLLHRAPAQSARLAGLHELPRAEDLGDAAIGAALRAAEPWATRRRAIAQERIVERIHRWPCPPALAHHLPAATHFVWASAAALAGLPLSGPHRRWIEQLRRAPVAARLSPAPGHGGRQ